MPEPTAESHKQRSEVGPAPILLVLILAISVGMRLWNLDHDVVGHHQHRASDTAAVATHYARGETGFLEPMVDWGGVAIRGVEMELPLYQYAVGTAWKFTGESYAVARALSVLAGLISLWLFYLFAKDDLDRPTARWALLVLAVLPTFAVFARAIQPESWMLLGFIGSIVAMQRWARTGTLGWVAVSAVAAAFSISIKATSAVLGLPLLVIVLRKKGLKGLYWPPALAHAAVSLGLPAVWYVHAARLGERTGQTFGISESANWGILGPFADPGWWWSLWVGKVAEDHLAIVGVPLVLAGLVLCITRRRGAVTAAWGVAMLVHIALAAYRHGVHDYYQLPLLPVLAVFAGVCLSVLASGTRAQPHARRTAVGLLVALTAVSVFTLHRIERKNPKDSQHARLVADAIRSVSEDRVPVLLLTGSDPTVLRLADRFGWVLPGEHLPARLDNGLPASPIVIAGAWRGVTDRGTVALLKSWRGREQGVISDADVFAFRFDGPPPVGAE